MKYLLFIYLLLFSMPSHGQKVYCNDYDSYNGISLLLYSNGTFILSSFSPESQYDPDDLPDLASPPVIWLEGEWTLHDGKIVSKNSDKYFFCFSKQQKEDILLLEKAYWHNKTYNIEYKEIYYDNKVFSTSLPELLPVYSKLYIAARSVTVDGGFRKLLNVYSWKEGEKKQLYENKEKPSIKH